MPAEFTPITTQEEFDTAIKARLERHARTVTAEVEKKYAGYISPEDAKKYEGYKPPEEVKKLTDQITALTAERDTARAETKKAQTDALRMRIAGEKKLPPELADRLRGETEEELRADADSFAKLMTPTKTAPMADPEPEPGKSKNSALRSLLSDISQ